jgi:hypothetical protein
MDTPLLNDKRHRFPPRTAGLPNFPANVPFEPVLTDAALWINVCFSSYEAHSSFAT